MLEYSANAATRDAIARAHAERGQMMRSAWKWVFRSRRALQTPALGAVS
ncbi:hypothetical protein [Parasedimentitalea huanghaiensis]|nr:hypothetical protein [Zongyanglinia huanghaiensis]